MEITVAGQTWMFLYAIILGAALGCCYDVFRILRIAFYNPPALILVEDLVFSILCAMLSFFYMLSVDEGQIRVFVLIGEAVGFALYFCTIGVLVIRVSKGMIAAIKWVCHWIWNLFVAPVLQVLKIFRRFLKRIFTFSEIYLKNMTKNANIHLKKQCDLLYNLKKQLQSGRHKKN